MNSFDPFANSKTTIDPQTVAANVRFWRIKHNLIAKPKFHNEPRLLKLSGKKIIIAIDQQMGPEVTS